ncbi:hypothetical protein C0J52_02848 [Blattella germanica]|nr:hypothetical protein C0J52_02848 [Blattella germanica]
MEEVRSPPLLSYGNTVACTTVYHRGTVVPVGSNTVRRIAVTTGGVGSTTITIGCNPAAIRNAIAVGNTVYRVGSISLRGVPVAVENFWFCTAARKIYKSRYIIELSNYNMHAIIVELRRKSN